MESGYSIETALLKKDQTSFPGEKPYNSLYKVAKQFMNEKIHPEIKAVAQRFLNGEYLNNHGERHIKDVILRASQLIFPIKDSLTSYELFLLLMAIQMHDAGHIIKGRKEHAETVKKLINDVLGKNYQIAGLDSVEKKFIFHLIKAHSGKDDPIGIIDENATLFGEKVRMRMLAAILRLADELAEDSLRASTYLLETDHEVINEKSRIFHKYSQALKSVSIECESHEIRFHFVLNDSDVRSAIEVRDCNKFLIDEVYDRTMKTWTEMIYYNRFVPEKIRMNRLSVKIEFLEENSLEDILPMVSYRLEESGYPKLTYDSVYDFDKEALYDANQPKNGQYFNDLLMKSHYE